MFDDLSSPAADSLMVVARRVRDDSRPDKLDLGVGVYRDADGQTPIMPVIREAASIILHSQRTKTYLSPAGDPGFVDLLARQVLSPHIRDNLGSTLAGIQAPGGTGALRLGAELLAATRPDTTVWVGTPTWPNHEPILQATRLAVRTYALIDMPKQKLRVDWMLSALSEARAGDVVLLQGCCHNPTGIDFEPEHWTTLVDLMDRRGLIPFVDFAYQGLGDGFDADATGVRLVFERLPEAILAVSCSKSFSLYCERVGLLVVKTQSEAAASAVSGTVQAIVRSLYSNPPGHGAALVRTVLEHPELVDEWRADLDAKRRRIENVRHALAEAAHGAQLDLSFLKDQRGLFSMLQIDPEGVRRLGQEFGIHMPETGRVNIAGLSDASIPRFIEALVAVQR